MIVISNFLYQEYCWLSQQLARLHIALGLFLCNLLKIFKVTSFFFGEVPEKWKVGPSSVH
jgi:hypothetical protein